MILLCMFIPLLGGLLTMFIHFQNEKHRNILSMFFTTLTSIFIFYLIFTVPNNNTLCLIAFTPSFSISFFIDNYAKLFAGLIAFLWPLASLYAYAYMEHSKRKNVFFGFYLLSYFVTIGIAFSANMFTLLVFFELLTLSTLFLVSHNMNAQSIYAARKYVYYAVFGASLVLVSLIGVEHYAKTTSFLFGGVFTDTTVKSLPILFLLGFLGFGVKAAIFPLHGWLPTASVAPTPVTALLHAVAVVKAGVFSIGRITYFIFGSSILQGSTIQHICIGISLFSILYGSFMALKEKHMKRRLAYSTISNLSYIVFGMMLVSANGLNAALMHMVFHALIKITLFCSIGIWMLYSGKEYLSDIDGAAKTFLPTFILFAFCAIQLVGIPPFIGFQSKWALATASYSQSQVVGLIGSGVLIISAILTAFYLFIPAINAFAFNAKTLQVSPNMVSNKKPAPLMVVPLIVITLTILCFAFFSQPLLDFIYSISIGLK